MAIIWNILGILLMIGVWGYVLWGIVGLWKGGGNDSNRD